MAIFWRWFEAGDAFITPDQLAKIPQALRLWMEAAELLRLSGPCTVGLNWPVPSPPVSFEAFRGVPLASVRALYIGPSLAADSLLKEIARPDSRLKAITMLNLAGTSVTDRGLKELSRPESGLKALTTLNLVSTSVTDAGLKELSRPDNPEQLKKELQRKQKQLALLTDDVQLEDDDVLTRKCNKIKADIRALHLRLQQIPQSKQIDKSAADAIAAKFAKEILDSADSLGELHNTETYRLLELLIRRMQVDLETMEVEIDFTFPSWVGSALQQGAVGLDSLSAYRQRIEAHPENSVNLAHFHCDYAGKPNQGCFRCHRLRPAA